MSNKRVKSYFLFVVLSLMLLSFLIQSSILHPQYPPLIKTNFNQAVTIPQSYVGITQSSMRDAELIEFKEIESMVSKAVDLAGGFADIIQDGEIVVLKPNLITDYDMTNDSKTLPPEVNGMTTDWRVAQAVVNLVRKINTSGKIYILEGVANGTTEGNMSTMKYTPSSISGVDNFIWLEEHSGGWREWNSPKLVSVILPANKSKYADMKKPNKSPEFYLNKIYSECDVLISLPVLKNHSQSNVTLAVKNVGIGGSPQNIYGGKKGDNHRFINDGIDHKPYYLHRFIHDYYLCRPVDFVIMDGLQGSVDGPVGIGGTNLKAVQKNMRLILAGKDAVSVDAIACLIMGYNPEKIGHLSLLHNDAAGCADASLIRVNGIQVHDVKTKFDNAINSDIKAWYSDYIAPEFEIASSQIVGNKLHLNITGDADITKIEVALDNKLLDQTVVGEFNTIQLDIPYSMNGFTQAKVFVYDAFLNCSSKIFNITSLDYSEIPKTAFDFRLIHNYPNPFNMRTRIIFSLDTNETVSLYIIDSTGRLIRRLIDNQYTNAGRHSIEWNGRNTLGYEVPSGVFFCLLQAGSHFDSRKMIVVK